MKRALILSLLIAPVAFSQTLEYGRNAADGTLDMTTKQARHFGGSLSLSTGRGFGASVGGTAVKDRVWFFASADRSSEIFRTTAPMAKSDIHAVLGTTRPAATTAPQFNLTVPKDFLALHSTTMLSPSSYVSVDVSQTRH